MDSITYHAPYGVGADPAKMHKSDVSHDKGLQGDNRFNVAVKKKHVSIERQGTADDANHKRNANHFRQPPAPRENTIQQIP